MLTRNDFFLDATANQKERDTFLVEPVSSPAMSNTAQSKVLCCPV